MWREKGMGRGFADGRPGVFGADGGPQPRTFSDEPMPMQSSRDRVGPSGVQTAQGRLTKVRFPLWRAHADLRRKSTAPTVRRASGPPMLLLPRLFITARPMLFSSRMHAVG
jgi:hypothetical protein